MTGFDIGAQKQRKQVIFYDGNPVCFLCHEIMINYQCIPHLAKPEPMQKVTRICLVRGLTN